MNRLSILRTAAVALAAAVCGHAGLLTDPPGQLSPSSGDLAGFNGTTVSWGLRLSNDTVDQWWVFTGVASDYTSTGAPGEIPDGSSFFTDLLFPYFFTNFFLNNTALAPGQDLNLLSPGSPVDLASFAISPTADPGTIPAQLHIFYDFYDSNPFDPATGSSATQLGSDQFDVDTTVTALGQLPQGSAVPEPGALWLMAGAGLLFAVRRRATA
ncbi:MAG TPA: PEP-CTERM sorting domain-containing protein [Candidatus Limnocylindrales bacterium]|nr:PEP-CTERM sorting domain-containing protein [Candidatus Limnocylindrales bacterium]